MAGQTAPKIGLRDLKSLVHRGRDRDDPLRRLIESQPDTLPADVFLARVADWLRLLDMAERRPLRPANAEDLDDGPPANEGGA